MAIRPVSEQPGLPQARPKTLFGMVDAFSSLIQQLSRIFSEFGYAINRLIGRQNNIIYVDDFGPTGEGDDSATINLAFAYLRDNASGAGNFANSDISLHFTAGKVYRVEDTINATDIRHNGWTVYMNGAVIDGHCTGKPVVDAMRSQNMTWYDLFIRGDTTDVPSYGFIHGRIAHNEVAQNCLFIHPIIAGEFDETAYYNLAAELTIHIKPYFYNLSTNAGARAAIMDAKNDQNITSAFVTVTISVGQLQSFNENYFLNYNFIMGVGTTGYAVKIAGNTNRHKYENGLAITRDNAAFEIEGDQYHLDIDVHHETQTAAPNFLLYVTDTGTTDFYSVSIRDHNPHADTAVIGKAGAGALRFRNSHIDIPRTQQAIPVFDTATSTFQFHGELRIGNEAALIDLSGLNRLDGTVYTDATASSVTSPSAGDHMIFGRGGGVHMVSDNKIDVAAHLAPAVDDTYDLGTSSLRWQHAFMDGVVVLGAFTVATLPSVGSYTGGIIYVSDETGGATLAFSDGTNWRRVQDRAIVS
jgi:hypothetical protein